MSVLSSIRDAWRRAFAPPLPVSVMGAGATGTSYTRQEYDTEHALSVMGAYVWGAAAISDIANDMSSLPIEVYDQNGEPVPDHWLIKLLERPDPEWSGVRWKRQWATYYLGAGVGYFRKWRTPTGRLYRLQLLHPHGMERVGDLETGELKHWVYRGQLEIPADEVVAIVQPSWRDDPQLEKLGESPIRALNTSIQSAIDARGQAGRAARRGRHEFMASPAQPMGPKGVKTMRDEVEASGRRGDAALVTDRPWNITQLSLTARDTEWHQLNVDTRDETLGRFGVPPVRAGMAGANYGESKQQLKIYWESTIMAHTMLWDAELTAMVEPGYTVRTSFESVQALQTSYTERLNRVTVWVQMGATPYEAAKAEGFREPPLRPETEPRVDAAKVPADPSLQVDTPQARDGMEVALEACRQHVANLAHDPNELEAACALELWQVMPRRSAVALASDIRAGDPAALTPDYARRLRAVMEAA